MNTAAPTISSLPLWERGLKYHVIAHELAHITVAPLVGAWIEIHNRKSETADDVVAPLVGAWIEMPIVTAVSDEPSSSLPSWERGLK